MISVDSRIAIYLESPCVVCDDTLSRSSNLLTHMEKKHSICLPARAFRARRPKSSLYRYVPSKPADAAESCLTHAACPCCWDHFADRDMLRQHIMQVHADVESLEKLGLYRYEHSTETFQDDKNGEAVSQPVSISSHQQIGDYNANNPVQQLHYPHIQKDNQSTSAYFLMAVEDLVNSLKKFAFASAAVSSTTTTPAAAANTNTASTAQRTQPAVRRKRRSIRGKRSISQGRRDSFISDDDDDIDSQASFIPDNTSVSTILTDDSF